MRLGWLRGARWSRERSTGLCWWDQRRRLARGELLAGPIVFLARRQAPVCSLLADSRSTGPALTKGKRALAEEA